MKNVKSKKLIQYDNKSDVLYFGIKEGAEEECMEIAPGINAELDESGRVIGIEILNASKVLKPVAKSIKDKALRSAV